MTGVQTCALPIFKESILVRISRYDVTSATKPSLEYPCLHFSRCWIGFACIRCSSLQAKTRRSQLRGKTCQTTEVYLDSYGVSACRWRMFDVQDIVIDCAMMSLDLIEGSHSEARCPVAGALKTKAPRKEMTSALQSIGESSKLMRCLSLSVSFFLRWRQATRSLSKSICRR